MLTISKSKKGPNKAPPSMPRPKSLTYSGCLHSIHSPASAPSKFLRLAHALAAIRLAQVQSDFMHIAAFMFGFRKHPQLEKVGSWY